MKQFVFLIVIGLALPSSCKKKETIQVYLSPVIKEYFDLKPGSYWHMKDSLTGRIDSFAVVENRSYTAREGNGINEKILVEIYQYANKDANQMFARLVLILWNASTVDIRYVDSAVNEHLTYDYCVNFPINDFLPTISMNGIQYSNVFKVGQTVICRHGDTVPTEFYFNKDAVLLKLKMDNITPVNWELIQHKIVR